MELTIGLCDPVSEPAAGLSPLPGIVLGHIVKFADHILWRTAIDGDGQPVRSTPDEYLGLAATTPEGFAEAQRLATEINAATGIDIPVADLRDVTKLNRRKVISEFCFKSLVARAQRAERRVGQFAEALSTVRREHETLLERFAQIEASVVFQGQQPVQVLCAQKTVEAFAELGESARLGRHAGLDLPFGTLGLYLLSLYIDAEDAEGPLDISIESRGTHRVLARWTHQLHNDKPDWQSWTRRLASTESYFGARLLLAFRGKGVVRIGMGPHHPTKRIWLAGANGQTDPRHIAIRALATTPGLRAPDTVEGAGYVKRLWDMDNALQIAPSLDEIPGLVSQAVEGGVIVTPVMGQVTAAGLGLAVPRGATAVRATGIVAHADGPMVDFALFVGSAETVQDLILSDQLEQSDAFPGWVTGAAMSPVLLTMVLLEPATGREELFLLTRISPDSSHDWCARAVFRNVQVLIDREVRDAG